MEQEEIIVEEKNVPTCPECGTDLEFEGHCAHCPECGWSLCSI